MAAHPTLAGERVVGAPPPIPRRRRRRVAPRAPLPLPRRKPSARPPEQAISAGTWLFLCAAPAVAAVIFAGLITG